MKTKPNYKFSIMKNEQTPAVPVMDIKELLTHKEVLLAFLEHASKDYPTGIGLAANQVGIINEDVVIDRMFGVDRFMLPAFAKKNRETDEWFLCLNPTIVNQVGLMTPKKEYCLTWPGKLILADRVHAIAVEYYDIEGKKHVVKAEGFEAQVWQHEINHLLGIPEEVVNSSGGLEVSEEPGRNDPCLCGSGKKYKKCCLNKPTQDELKTS